MEPSDGSCFRPSPVKGLSYKSEAYDADNSSLRSVSETKYRIRFGPMFQAWGGANADELPAHVQKGYCKKEYESGLEFILS